MAKSLPTYADVAEHYVPVPDGRKDELQPKSPGRRSEAQVRHGAMAESGIVKFDDESASKLASKE